MRDDWSFRRQLSATPRGRFGRWSGCIFGFRIIRRIEDFPTFVVASPEVHRLLLKALEKALVAGLHALVFIAQRG